MIGLQEDQLTFGGYPVIVRGGTNETPVTLVTCKGVTGTLDQLEQWLYNHYKDPYTKYYFGYGDKQSEIVRDGSKVKIACLEEDYVEFKLKLNKFIYGVSRS